MTDKKNQPAEKTHLSWSWLRMALSLREKVKLGDKQVIFIWAVVVGALGALMALVFEMGVELVQDVLTGRTSYRQIQVFQEMAGQDPAWCIFVPAAGGLFRAFSAPLLLPSPFSGFSCSSSVVFTVSAFFSFPVPAFVFFSSFTGVHVNICTPKGAKSMAIE